MEEEADGFVAQLPASCKLHFDLIRFDIFIVLGGNWGPTDKKKSVQ
jgi:hypothetical protein